MFQEEFFGIDMREHNDLQAIREEARRRRK